MKKNQYSRTLLAILVLMVFISCGPAQQSESNHDHMNMSGHQHDMSMSTDSMSSHTESGIVKAYLELKDAFVQSDARLASEKAGILAGLLKDHKAGGLFEAAEKLAAGSDIEVQREQFEKLSESMYKMAKANHFGAGTLYKQYCPMAFNNAGAYWLSAEKEIMNPYFGNKMLHCGKVEETIVMK